MATVRRAGSLVLTTFVMCLLSTPPALAQGGGGTPEAFSVSSNARALDLNLLGTHVTVGSTGALVTSAPRAEAQGAGVLLIGGTVAKAQVSGGKGLDDPPAACLINLPLNLVNLATACGDAKALIGDLGPAAAAQGGVASIEVGLSLLQPLIDQLTALLGQVIGTVVDPLLALLGDLLKPLLGSLNLNLNNVVDDLLAGLRRATSVLRVQIGTSASEAVTQADQVAATAVAAGAKIDVLPGLALSGAPLISVVVGSAKAGVSVKRAPVSSGAATVATATPTFDPAIVTIRLGLPLLGNITEIPVRLGQPIVLLAGSPLESKISLGAGRAANNPDGSATAVADGVSVELLKGVGGGIGLSLAHAEAAGGGLSATLVPLQVSNPTPILPPTGGTPWVPITGFGLLAVALASRRLARTRI